MTTINLNVGETMFLRVIGSRYTVGATFNSLTVRDTVEKDSIVKRMKDKMIKEICISLSNKGLINTVDKENNLYSLTEFGFNSFNAIMDKVAGRSRCASNNSYSGVDKNNE